MRNNLTKISNKAIYPCSGFFIVYKYPGIRYPADPERKGSFGWGQNKGTAPEGVQSDAKESEGEVDRGALHHPLLITGTKRRLFTQVIDNIPYSITISDEAELFERQTRCSWVKRGSKRMIFQQERLTDLTRFTDGNPIVPDAAKDIFPGRCFSAARYFAGAVLQDRCPHVVGRLSKHCVFSHYQLQPTHLPRVVVTLIKQALYGAWPSKTINCSCL